MRLRPARSRALSIMLATIAAAALPAPSRAALPPAAQASFDTGMAAVRQQEWLIAIRSFEEAREAAPDAPEISYNLGLAESKIPGRELRAMAWLAAYLAAEPDAPNASAVIAQINALDVKSQANLASLVKDAANPESMAAVLRIADLVSSTWQREAYRDVATADMDLAKAQSELGDSATSIQMVRAADMIAGKTDIAPNISDPMNEIAEHLADAGQFKAAAEMAELAEHRAAIYYGHLDSAQQSLIWNYISHAQMDSRDFTGASTSAGRISDNDYRQGLLEQITIREAAAATEAGTTPTPVVAQAVSASDIVKAVFGAKAGGPGLLDEPIFLNSVDYLDSLNSADPHDVIKDFWPTRGIHGAEDWASAGKPLVLFCALAEAAAAMAEAQRKTEHYTKSVITQSLAHADRKAH